MLQANRDAISRVIKKPVSKTNFETSITRDTTQIAQAVTPCAPFRTLSSPMH